MSRYRKRMKICLVCHQPFYDNTIHNRRETHETCQSTLRHLNVKNAVSRYRKRYPERDFIRRLAQTLRNPIYIWHYQYILDLANVTPT